MIECSSRKHRRYLPVMYFMLSEAVLQAADLRSSHVDRVLRISARMKQTGIRTRDTEVS